MLYTRAIQNLIKELCFQSQKMAFVSGPRQVGKTTLSKQLSNDFTQSRYFTWDDPKSRRAWIQNPSSFLEEFSEKTNALLVVDEIHKSKNWKTQLKGIWDQRKEGIDLLVTGSAQINILKKAGDSLVGRYYHFHLDPLTVGEVLGIQAPPDELLNAVKLNQFSNKLKGFEEVYLNLKKFSGFPEPFKAANQRKLNLWRKTRLERIIREDLRDLSKIDDLSMIEMLASLLPEKVGSPLSVENLRADLETSHSSVRRWLLSLESVYHHYILKPYSKKISSALKKEPKLYLYDYTTVENEGALFENLVSNHLMKFCNFWTDSGWGDFKLHYVKTKQKSEIDFLITLGNKPWLAVETKKSRQQLSQANLNLMASLKCPVVLLTESNVKSTLTRENGFEMCCVSVSQFLPLLG